PGWRARKAGARFFRARPRHRRRRPAPVHRGRQAAAELADVPRAADVEGEEAGGEVLIEVGDLPFRRRRRKAAAKDVEIELERRAKGAALEVAVAIAVAQQRR